MLDVSTYDDFRALHVRGKPLLMPNPWDVGSARILATAGFLALATTSSGFAATLGRPDGGVDRDEAIDHAAAIASTVGVPVSADLENGFGDTPEDVAATIRAAAETGLAGCSVEDATGRAEDPIYDPGLAAERAGVGAAFRAELEESQAALLAQLDGGVRGMFPKAYRWVAEFDEIASFIGARPEAKVFEGIARLYDELAKDVAGAKTETGTLAGFFAPRNSKTP